MMFNTKYIEHEDSKCRLALHILESMWKYLVDFSNHVDIFNDRNISNAMST